MPIPFRLKLGILLLIMAVPFLISQAIYRQTIVALHDSFDAAVDVLNIIHATETFHASLHTMLNVAGQFAVASTANTVPADWQNMQKKAATALDRLQDSLQRTGGYKGQAIQGGTHQSDDITPHFTALMKHLDAVLAGPVKDVRFHMASARQLFDEIFQDHLDTLHTHHQHLFEALQLDAHRLKQRVDLLFYAQSIFLAIIVIVALFFSEKILVKGYLRIEDASFSDGLTKARNRRYLETVTEGEVEIMLDRKIPFSMALLDIDHFKRVNDEFGHQSGDEVLRGVADIVRGGLRKSDTFARFGGEEFLILLPGANRNAAVAVVEKIRKAIESHAFFPESSADKKVTASAGLAAFPDDGLRDFASMQKLADTRLYLAKDSGRNRCVSQGG